MELQCNKTNIFIKKIIILVVLLSLICMMGCSRGGLKREKSFVLNVRPETKENIHVVSFDEYINGYSNTTMSSSTDSLSDGKVFDFILSSEEYDKKDIEKSDYYIKLYVSEKIPDENSNDDDIHKDEIPVKNKIKIPVKYGKTYNIVITGDKKNGYEAELK